MIMLSQVYIKSYCNNHILCVLNAIANNKKGVVVLVPGFSQSKSDMDYFMTRLANKLVDMGYDTVQVDLFAHGDSYGVLEKFTWEIFVQNLIDIYRYIDRNYKIRHKYLVTRGVFGNISMNTKLKELYDIICVNPIINIEKCIGMLNVKNGEFAVNKLLSEDAKYEYLFNIMGSEITNVKGQSINYQLITSLLQYNEILLDNIILTYDSSLDTTLKEQAETCFVREFFWQESLIEKIIEKMEEMHKLI